MAQLDSREKLKDPSKMKISDSSCNSFKFNAQAPEFVPRSQIQIPNVGYSCPYFQFLGANGSDWFYVGDQEPMQQMFASHNVPLSNYSKNVLSDDLQKKIVKQAEYQFNDMSLLANDTLIKQVNKDPEGYVPISVVANTKKIKPLVSNNHLLAQALRASSKLVVSNDGKKVRRKHVFTDRDKEELQCRVVVAENLPEDYSHQNLEKTFNVVGSVKSIRICHPQESNPARAKGDCVFSNKLHALVEYGTTDIAEKAVEKLNDERNWRKGLRVRLLHRRSPKSVLKSWKSDFDEYFDEEDDQFPESSTKDSSHHPNNTDSSEENAAGAKKVWGRVRGKNKARFMNHNTRVLQSPCTQSSSSTQCEASSPKQGVKGPRMPDGTRGFSIGRGKPMV